MSEKVTRTDFENAARIVRDSGGRVIGRTKLQKMAYFLEAAGLGDGFSFNYKHYGPYSEDLSQAIELANIFGLISEQEKPASWGGTYSIYSFSGNDSSGCPDLRKQLLECAVSADAVELELAATALFLHADGVADAWKETCRRKPDKASSERLLKSKTLYEKLRTISGNRLPVLRH
jgi:uncharacterized protein YwgA